MTESAERDVRTARLADFLVAYSLGVQPGETILISGHPCSEPLIMRILDRVLHQAAVPVVRLAADVYKGDRLRLDEPFVDYVNPFALTEDRPIDCSIGIWSKLVPEPADNGNEGNEPGLPVNGGSETAPNQFVLRAAASGMRWVGVEYPTAASAADAGMSRMEFEEFVFRAGYLDQSDPGAAWSRIRERQQRLCDYLERGAELRFVTPTGTDVTMGIEHRHWINADGHFNFPDGEVFSAPVEDSVQGTVCSDYPVRYQGRRVEGVRLRFRDGVVVEASAARNEAVLLHALENETGARVLGEIGLGTNRRVTRHTNNETLDEKIGGTFHVALGAAYPETGGSNRSSFHRDIVVELRQGGRAELDGQILKLAGMLPGTDR